MWGSKNAVFVGKYRENPLIPRDLGAGHSSVSFPTQRDRVDRNAIPALLSDIPRCGLERLFEGAQIDLMRPGRRMLLMQMPVRFGDGINIQQPVQTSLFDYRG